MKKCTTRCVKVAMLSAVSVSLASVAFASMEDVRTWTDASGDHRWNNASNWNPQRVDSTRNIFPGGRNWEVIVEDSDKSYYSLELAEGTGTVTLKGANSAKLKSATGAFIKIAEGRELNVDGPEIQLTDTDISTNGFINGTLRTTSGYLNTGHNASKTFGGIAKVIVDGGVFGCKTGDSTLTFTNNATLTINGGLAQIPRGVYCSPDPPCESITRVRLLGGTYWNPNKYSYTTRLDAGAHFVNTGGMLVWGLGDDFQYNCLSSKDLGSQGVGEGFADFLPLTGGKLVVPTSTTNPDGAVKFYYSNRDYNFGGTIYATNNTEAAAGNIYFVGVTNKSLGLGGGTLSVRGGATIYANAFKVNSSAKFTIDLDLADLNLGAGGICRNGRSDITQYINFLDGIKFGAWGNDVSRSAAYTHRMFVGLEGPVVYDTQDCFDPTTSRNIEMDCLKMDGMTELKAVGGGIVSLYPSSMGVDELRTLEVGDGTTLAFCTNTTVGLKTMNLKLGENAKLKINMKNGDYVDASATAVFGEGAKIVVTDLPATLTEGMFYPIYFAPTGTDPDLSKIMYDEGDWPTGWYLAKRGSAVYLTDGKEPVYSELDQNKKYSWSGGGSDNIYSNLCNWANDVCSIFGGADIHFNGRKNTDIYSDKSTMLQRLWIFGEDAGPFLFSGGRVRFQYPRSDLNLPSILNESKFPVAVSNELASADFALWPAARQQGSISLMGLGSMTNALNNQYVPLLVAGDIRIGGAYTSEYVRVAAKTYNSYVQRTTRLTIMPGGSLKVLNQFGDFNELGVGVFDNKGAEGGAFAVATGGTLDISGAELLLTGDNTHYVDGVMTVDCPFATQGRQVFRGDGTLTLSGGISGDGCVRVEGGLTLVPGGAWGSGVTLSIKDDVTIAPTADWTFGDGATVDLAHNSVLTFATGGHKVTLDAPIVSGSGKLAVTGGGRLVLANGDTRLDRLSIEEGSTVSVGTGLIADGEWVTVLAVRDDSVPIEFSAERGRVKQWKYVDDTGYTVYCVKRKKGMTLIFK